MAEDPSTQQPAQGADKAPAPATFSSFINKNTSGKKFAPKAARRRPGAAAAPAPKGPAPTPASSGVEPQPAQAETAPSRAEPTVTAPPLPTPAPTQQDTSQNAASQQTPAATAREPSPTPAVEPSQPTQPTQHVLQPQTHASRPVQDDDEGGRSPKRRRIESPSRQSAHVPVAVMVPQDAHTDELLPQEHTPAEGPSASTTPAAEADAGAPTQQQTRTGLPWTAVNRLQEEGGEVTEAVETSAKKKRAPPKARGKKAADGTAEAEEQQENGEEEAQSTQKKPRPRARAQRNSDTAEAGQDGEPVQPPAKKPRKPRRDNGKQRAEDDVVDGETGQEGAEAAKPKRKPSVPRRKKSTPAEGENGSVEPKRRGRPAREDTPPEAEGQAIDPDTMCMDDLASRNIRVGKLSRREKEMRKIDWDAVKQRRREEDARHISTKETQAAVDKLLETGEVEQVPTGPRYHVVDGRIELIQDSGTIDRERDADREIEMMTITEEDDLTTRITSRSFMKNNKRFPNEFVLPGQGKRWDRQSTEMFYQGLRSFGTDFQMIAHMFPGMTRRSIKTKFTREERENPEIVRACLRGESQLASHWDHFLAASQLEEESFADADAIKRELEEEEARMREQINEALKEKEEREKQKKLAGVTEDGDGAADKDGKGKKKRKQKDKTVTFQEQGVEIVGDIDDDPNWGQE